MQSLVQWVLREAYLESCADLRDAADKVRYSNELKKGLRDAIAQGRTDLLQAQPWPRERRVAVFRAKYARAADPVERQEKRSVDRKALTLILKDYDARLTSLAEEEQLMQINLQTEIEKQQQTIQTISRISKLLNDTAMAVIRKIGG